MIEAAESATSIAEEQRLASEADMYMIEQHFYVWVLKLESTWRSSRGSKVITEKSTLGASTVFPS